MNGPVVRARGLAFGVSVALPAFIVVGTGLAFAVLNIGGLGEQSYWTDELLSVGFANEELERMVRLLGGDTAHPPLYSSLLWVWIRLTGTATEATVRLVSLLSVSIGIVVLGMAVWRWIGAGAGSVFLALASTSTLVATFAQEARPHAMAFGLVCIATTAWWQLLRAPSVRRRDLALFAAVGGLAALTQYYALLVYAVEVAVLVSWLVLIRRWRESVLTAVIATMSVVPVGVWLAVTSRLFQPSSTPALTMTWAEDVAGWAAQPFTSVIVGAGGDGRPGLLLVFGAISLALIGMLIAVIRQRGEAGESVVSSDAGALGVGAAALATGLISVAIAVVESLVLWPTLHYRSIMSILPVMYVGIGAGLTLPFRRLGDVAGVSIAVLFLVAAVQTPPQRLYLKDGWREAAAIVIADVRAGLPANRVAVVESPWGTRVDWILTLNNAVERQAPASDLPPEVRELKWINGSAALTQLSADERLLLVAFHYWSPDRHTAIVATAHERFGPCDDRSLQGITVLDCNPGAAH